MWSVRGKVCLITGATSGIGRETALGLARNGARLAIVARDRALATKLEAAARRAGSPAVDLFFADLAVQSDVRRVAGEILAKLPAIDVFISNAGIVMNERELTVDGVGKTFAVNHLAPFLLAKLLRERIEAAAPSRIIIVASQVEARGAIDFDDLTFAKGYTPLGAYDRSKLANVLFTYELARRLHERGVTVNCLHPGVIATNLLSDYERKSRLGGKLLRLTHSGPKEGAATTLRLATDPKLIDVSGRHFKPTGEARTSPASYDLQLARRLWEISEQLVGEAEAPLHAKGGALE
ncbi:MAG: SDR family oxidoreductase [Myxococcales bacterium]|nr:SDR family oxidoreductase [Myxococcales bacterium]